MNLIVPLRRMRELYEAQNTCHFIFYKAYEEEGTCISYKKNEGVVKERASVRRLAIWRWWTELGRCWRMRRRIHAYHVRTLY